MPHRPNPRSLAALVLSAVLFASSAAWPAFLPSVARADEVLAAGADPADEESAFSYQHNPIYNPRAMEDVVVNPEAVYGFSPNPDAGSISGYAAYDWTDPAFVAQAHENRKSYVEQDRQMLDIVKDMQAQGAPVEEIARTVSARRNQIRLDSYKDDPEGLALVKARNLEKYGNEEGPTPEWLYDRYGSWEAVIDSAFSTNPGMDACCGLYDENWESYVYFGQIPLCTVSFDAAGHGAAPAAQSVYAGELADEPEDPEEEGWTFLGWFAEGSEEPFDFSEPIAGDVVVTASWEEESAEDEDGEDDSEEDEEDKPSEDGEDDPEDPDVIPDDDADLPETAVPTAAPAASVPSPAKPSAQVATGRGATLPATGDPAAESPAAMCFACGMAALALGIGSKVRLSQRR